MAFKETVRVVQAGTRRLKVFVDFWNVVISARQQAKVFDVDVRWDRLVDNIVRETNSGYHDESSGELAGCYIFGSFAKSDPREKSFIDRTLDKYGSSAGLFFEFKERVKKKTSDTCKGCGSKIERVSELGVDVLLTVEMIKHSLMREHEYLALVSGDRDYIPLLGYLKDQGQRVLHIATDQAHRDMRTVTWKQVSLREDYSQICYIADDGYIFLTMPGCEEKLEQCKSIAFEQKHSFKVFDVTDKAQLNDRDLVFVLSNQMKFFKRKGADNTRSFSAQRLAKSLNDFRSGLRDGDIVGDFPHVIFQGDFQVRGDNDLGWMINGSSDVAQHWKKFQAKR